MVAMVFPSDALDIDGSGGGSGESLDELQRGLRDLGPSVVNGQRVAPAGDLGELGHAWVVLLPLVLSR
jgi:hypothetical protein